MKKPPIHEYISFNNIMILLNPRKGLIGEGLHRFPSVIIGNHLERGPVERSRSHLCLSRTTIVWWETPRKESEASPSGNPLSTPSP